MDSWWEWHRPQTTQPDITCAVPLCHRSRLSKLPMTGLSLESRPLTSQMWHSSSMSQQKSAVYFTIGDHDLCYLLADFSTICMCLFFSDEISHYPLNYSVKQGEMTAMTASPIGLYFEKRTRPTCVTPSPGRSDAIHFAPWKRGKAFSYDIQREFHGAFYY